MSLSDQAFFEALERCEKMSERLKKLLGFNPADDDHYGCIWLYNHSIDLDTPDETIVKIQEDYVQWQERFLAWLAEKGWILNSKQLEYLLCSDMYGRMTFLKVPINIHQGMERYENAVDEYIKGRREEGNGLEKIGIVKPFGR